MIFKQAYLHYVFNLHELIVTNGESTKDVEIISVKV